MAGLLDLLFGGANAPAQTPPSQPITTTGPDGTPHSWTYDTQGNIIPAAANPQAAMASAAATPQAPPGQSLSGAVTPTGNNQGSQAPITVTGQRTYQPDYQTNPELRQARGVDNATQAADSNPGSSSNYDGFKPRKAGFLGDLADYLLGTHIGDHIHRLNMEAAMQHYTSDPEESVRRIATFDPEMAAKIQSDTNQTLRWNEYAKHMTASTDLNNFKQFGTVAGNMAWNITHDAQGNPVTPTDAQYQQMRGIATRIGTKYGIDPEMMAQLLPDQYTPEAGQTLASMMDPAKSQAMLAFQQMKQAQELPIQKQKADAATLIASQAPVNAGAHVMQARAAQQQANNGTTNAQTNQQNAATRAQGEAKQPDKGQHGFLSTRVPVGKNPDGSVLYQNPEISPDGTQARVKVPAGSPIDQRFLYPDPNDKAGKNGQKYIWYNKVKNPDGSFSWKLQH